MESWIHSSVRARRRLKFSSRRFTWERSFFLTNRDVLRCGQWGKPAARELPVSEVMTRQPTSVRPAMGLAQVARLMLERKFGCLPVCEDDGTLVGIVTEADFVRFAADVVRDLDLVAEAVRARERTGSA